MNKEKVEGVNHRTLELKKHVAVIHSNSKISLLQRKISNALLFHAYDEPIWLANENQQMPNKPPHRPENFCLSHAVPLCNQSPAWCGLHRGCCGRWLCLPWWLIVHFWR